MAPSTRPSCSIPTWGLLAVAIPACLLLLYATPAVPITHLRRYNPLSSGFTSPTICGDEFYVPWEHLGAPECFVRAPPGYQIPFPARDRLWRAPRKNLGALNRSHPDHKNQLHRQRWAQLKPNVVVLNDRGGTSMRNFGDNQRYARLLLNWTAMGARCGAISRPAVLDTGAGIASMASGMRDERGGNASAAVLSYVPVDTYLRLGTVIADRALPVFLHFFTGAPLPFPPASFDVVHCRWCWHHLAGYDAWLREVNRLLVPGGAFVFTFVPVTDEALLPRGPWEAALARQPWDCAMHERIVTVCRKRGPAPKGACALRARSEPAVKIAHDRALDNDLIDVFSAVRTAAERPDAVDRILNVNCPANKDCKRVEKLLRVPSMLSTFTPRHKDMLRRMINAGSLGILHDWEQPAPFYPRMLDAVNVMCDADTEALLESRAFFVEMHRILRPRGFLTFLYSACESASDAVGLMMSTNFEILKNENGNVVARRLDV